MRVVMVSVLLLVAVSAAQDLDFSGTWDTTYGVMVLFQEGDQVTGYYDMGGICPVEGTVNLDGRLEFTYTEPITTGEGWFDLSLDGMAFSGMWRETGGVQWIPWEGYRAGAGLTPSNWLVILEAEWQESMTESEYSFGEMLAAWFARVPGVTVRHRFVHDVEDLAGFCLEASALPGDVYLILASHGTAAGIALPGGTVTGDNLIAALSPIRNLAMLHFSACEVMAGNVPAQLLASRNDWPDGFVVSGYTLSVDWGASGMLEIFYMNQILENGLPPAEAARCVIDEIGFAGDRPTEWMDPAGFTWMEPGTVPTGSGRRR